MKNKRFCEKTDAQKRGPHFRASRCDYKDAAMEFIQGWRDSKGHYKNIITPDFNITGIALSYNSKTQALYAVQTFGKTQNEIKQPSSTRPVYQNNSTRKIYTKPKPHRHAWNIKSGDKLKDYDQCSKQKSKNSKKSG